VNTWIVDTGPLVAYIDAEDRAHVEIAGKWDAFSGQLATTSAVITETVHIVRASPQGPRQLAELVAASGIEAFDFCSTAELHAAVDLMARYADTPMDFADATLLLLADVLDVRHVLTLDRRGFAAYRTPANQALINVLDET
jgi:predicted nucleic acid-binding protein